MATSTASRNPNSRSVARRLLSRWQKLDQMQRDVFEQMSAVESELAEHVELNRYTEYRGVRGSFTDAFLDSNLDHDSGWIGDAINAAGL